MTRIEELLDGIAAADADQVRAAGEAARDEAERLARSDPHRLDAFLAVIRGAAEQRQFLPWALWVEGTVEQLRGRPAVAGPLLGRSSTLFRRRGDHHVSARVEIALMDALACLGNHRNAARRGRRALEELRCAGDTPRVVSALINLGGLADARDQVRTAIKLWRQAQRLLDPSDDRRRALILGCLAGAMQALGQFRKATTLYEKELSLCKSLHAGASALRAQLGLAEVMAMLGDVDRAIAEIRNVRQVADHTGDDHLAFEAALLMAGIELRLGQNDRALSIADTTMPRCEQAGRYDDVARLAALRAMAVARGGEGEIGEATAVAEQALQRAGLSVAAAELRLDLARCGVPAAGRRLARDAGALERAGMLIQADLARLTLAKVLAGESKLCRARRLCNQVLQHRHASVWPRLEAHRVMAELCEPDVAMHHLGRAVRLADSVRGRLGSDADRNAFSATVIDCYERLVELLLQRGDSRSRRRAFELVARLKSRSLLEALDRRRDLTWRDSPDLVRRWSSMRKELAAMLAAIEGRREGQARYATSVVAHRVRSFARRLEDIELDLARAHPSLGAILGHLPEPRLRPLLTGGEVFLEVLLLGQDMAVFHLDRSGLRVRMHRGCRDSVEQLVQGIRFQLAKAAYGRCHLEAASGFLVSRLRSRFARLGEMLLDTLKDRPHPDRLYLAPHGSLHHLPLAALELGGRPLTEICPLAVVPSSGVLARILGEPLSRPGTLGVAGSAPAELPEIVHEVNEIAEHFPGASSVLPDAKTADVRGLLGRHDTVHIASHGAFQAWFPAGSGIRLADGWLTALDLLQTPIHARLVTMGACSSGQVSVSPGEELMGVIRALLAGGVCTAVLAPGVLDDRIGRETARLFYQNLFHHGPGEALQKAQLALRSEHRHPALWAALQLYGNPRPYGRDSNAREDTYRDGKPGSDASPRPWENRS